MNTTKSNLIESIISVVPERFIGIIQKYIDAIKIEELRFRVNQSVQLIYSDGEVILNQYGIFTYSESKEMLKRMCKSSVYAMEAQLRCGYISLQSGIRVGICGKPVMDSNRILTLDAIQSFNIRIPCEALGCASKFVDRFFYNGYVVNSIIAASPGVGKTTFLRDLARCFSDGINMQKAYRVGIADERNELSACVEAVPSFNIGSRSDVFTLMPKFQSIPLLIRNMSPEVLITDEIITENDCAALENAVCHGVAVIATMHANSYDDVINNKSVKSLLDRRIIKNVFILRRKGTHMYLDSVKGENND